MADRETHYLAGTNPVPVALPIQNICVLFGVDFVVMVWLFLLFFVLVFFKQHSLLFSQVEVFHSDGTNSRIWGFL